MMADTPKPGDGAADPIPQPVANPEPPTPAGPPVEEQTELPFWQPMVYEPPGSKGRFRSFRDSYGIYGIGLLVSGIMAYEFGLLAYRLDPEHFWFHVCIELAGRNLDAGVDSHVR